MTSEELNKQAFNECNSDITTAHHGGGFGRPFWNAESFQFMYVPSFQFQPIPGYKHYRFTAKDEQGNIHTFDAQKASALLTPIWKELPEGVVELTVHTVNKDDTPGILVGARTFFKLAPFNTGLLKPAKYSYKESAAKAFNYVMNLDFIRYWLENGIPDPSYNLNVYPSKMISAVIGAMLDFTRLCPEKEADALKIAENAADYLISKTPSENHPMKGVPPTYQLDFCDDALERFKGTIVMDRYKTTMMIYPAYVGTAYLQLEAKTDKKKYLDAAMKIAEFYLKTVQPNGSWYLVRDTATGEPVSVNYCDPLPRIVPFLMSLYERTNDIKWKTLVDNAILFTERDALVRYNWEAQFEDSDLCANYSNLTHYGAAALVRYYAKYYSDNEEKMQIADNLMRFIEDQFVVWHRPAPWNRDNVNTSLWHTPCGLEQYNWHMPIDASIGDIILTFLAMYKAGRGELHLAKAKALTDSITNVQRHDGMIPTHWMDEDTINGKNFWINCMVESASAIAVMSEI